MAKRKSASAKKTTRQPGASRAASSGKRPAKKATSRQTAAGKKTSARNAPARKKAGAKKPASKKTPAKASTAPRKPAAKKVSSKKTASKNAPPKKAAAGKKKKTATKASSAKAAASEGKTAGKPASRSPKKSDSTKARSNGKHASARTETKAEVRAREAADAKTLKEARDAASRLAALAGLPAVVSGDAPPRETQKKRRRLTKSPIGAKQLAAYRELLLQKRREVVGNVSSIEGEALNPERSGSLSALPQHMADQGSDEFDQTLSLGIAASQRKLLQEIDDALERLDKGVFGICEMTGGAIPRNRLEVTPWCRYSYEGAQMADRGHPW